MSGPQGDAVSPPPKLPEIDRPSTDEVLEGAPSTDEIVDAVPAPAEISEERPGLDEILGRGGANSAG
jgi:hypothetical protein